MRKRFKKSRLNKLLGHEAVASEVASSHAFGQVARRNLVVPSRRPSQQAQRVVKGYRHSMVGSTVQYRSGVPVQPREPAEAAKPLGDDVLGNRPMSGKKDEAKTGVDRRAFSEPPKRNFNPFG